MKVIVTPEAQAELNEIWNWNARDRGIRHADGYLSFLDKQIDGLSKTHTRGKVVGTRPDLRYIQMRRKTRGHGHVVIYIVGTTAITVLHIFHTAQNWQTLVAEDAS